MRTRPRNRPDDERILGFLEQKIAGKTWPSLDGLDGRCWQSAQQACFAVRRADEAESGEDTSGAYW